MSRAARRWTVGGRVQGVGFRPFVYNLAERLGLGGWVRNELGQVAIVGEGATESLDRFEHALIHEAPPLAKPVLLGREQVEFEGVERFAIHTSFAGAETRIHVPPDYFACEDCIGEMRDPADRRYAYPFINCTQCGPRYTLIVRLPYDRPNTTMASFELCPNCRTEYENPTDRRFHAQPVACPECGPKLTFRAGSSSAAPAGNGGSAVALPGMDDFGAAIAALRAGRIVAVKGIGGYHLACDATDEEAVHRLRERKPRPDKPLAVMFPGDEGLATLKRFTVPEPVHEQALVDPMRPIVLTPKRKGNGLAKGIAPGLGEIGAFLPYSPLHHLLLDAVGTPIVATSANVSGEPVLTDNAEVERRLGHVADAYLHHDRPIHRPADDPVFRVISGEPRPIRMGRGCAPVERDLPFRLSQPVLAVGGHMKNTVALAWEDRVVVSPHIGDLDAPRSLEVFRGVIDDLQDLYQVRAAMVVCDAHPGYASTRWAKRQSLPSVSVLHHHAHASGLAGEYPAERDWIVFTWDAVGYGEGGTLWGGEAFTGRPGGWERGASIRPFRLPGGERVGREPWRSAVGVCWETGMVELPSTPAEDLGVLRHAWERGLNAPWSTGVGRLFDAVSSILGVCQIASFEGQGPMQLEALAESGAEPWATSLRQRDAQGPGDRSDGMIELDWSAWLPDLFDKSASAAERASRFHASVAAALVDQAMWLRERTGFEAVGLSGGVFQNRLLCESAEEALLERGFRVYLHSALPANDGGLSFGQIMEYSGILGVH